MVDPYLQQVNASIRCTIVKIGKSKGQVFIISVYKKFSAKEHQEELFKGHGNGEELLFCGMVILLGMEQFTTPVTYICINGCQKVEGNTTIK